MLSSRIIPKRHVAVLLGLLLSFVGLLSLGQSPGEFPTSEVDRDIGLLSTAKGQVSAYGFINPGGPWFGYSEPMRRLVACGNAIQPRLLAELENPMTRNEVALVLAKVADKDARPRLIELLPITAKLTPAEEVTTTCLLYALWQTTGISLGINSKWLEEYTPQVRDQWLAWYESNKNYLYGSSFRADQNWANCRVLIDLEAKLAGEPTESFRRKRPWIAFKTVKAWRDDLAYERTLKEFCFTTIINLAWKPHGYAPREAIAALGMIPDPRAAAALRALGRVADGPTTHDLIWALEERGDSMSIPVLEKLQLLATEDDLHRSRAIQRIRQREKHREDLRGKPLSHDQQYSYQRCLEGQKGVDELVELIRKRDGNCSLADYLHVAGFVDCEPVRNCLKEVIADEARAPRYRARAHAALARLGEKASLDHLKKSLAHEFPCVRLAAAEGLWLLESREGFQTLVDLVDLRPVVSDGRGANTDSIRSASILLGQIGDRSAVETLKRLVAHLAESGTGGGGAGWCGRAAIVALAKLGDFTKIEHLRASIRDGDPHEVVGRQGGRGCFSEIGLRRFVPELLPMLNHDSDAKRVSAAIEILLLLEHGK